MPQNVRKGDLVRVIAGDDRKKPNPVGRVLRVLPREQQVVVEGMNVRKKHVRPSQKNPQGGIVEREMPIHISNVQPVVDGNKPTRVRFAVQSNGSKVRVAVRGGQTLGDPLKKPRK